jgi:hypothetical protein
MPDEAPEDREERLSNKRSQIQILEREDERVVRELCRLRREHLLRIVEEEELETRLQIEQRRAKIISQPDTTNQELDEDEDL